MDNNEGRYFGGNSEINVGWAVREERSAKWRLTTTKVILVHKNSVFASQITRATVTTNTNQVMLRVFIVRAIRNA